MREVETDRIGPAPFLAVDFAGDGPLVLFLHGIGGNRSNWRKQLAPVAALGFKAVTLDLRGYGDSDDYPGSLKFEEFSDDVLRVVNHFGANQVTLVGLSMGGRVSLDFYRRHPERVAGLVLCDTSAGNERIASAAEVEKFLALRKKPLLEGKAPVDIAPTVADSFLGPNVSDGARSEVIAALAQLHPESYIKTLDTVTRYRDFPPFSSIEVPTMVIVGEFDPIATPRHARRMASEMQRAGLAIIENSGHISNVEQPDAFNAVLTRFLSELNEAETGSARKG